MILFIYLAFEPIYTASSLGSAYIRDDFHSRNFSLTCGDLFSLPEMRYIIIQSYFERYGFEIKHFGKYGYREISMELHILKRRNKLHIISEIFQLLQWDISPALLYLEEGGYIHPGARLSLSGEISISHFTTRISAYNIPGYISYERLQEYVEVQEIYKQKDYAVYTRLTLLEGKSLNAGFAIKSRYGILLLSTGISLFPPIETFGIEIPYKRLKFQIGISSHPQLGLSEAITVIYGDE